MASILIPDVQDAAMNRLHERAVANGRTPEAEAKAILEQQLERSAESVWSDVNAFRHQLAASGRAFVDSADLVREDRER